MRSAWILVVSLLIVPLAGCLGVDDGTRPTPTAPPGLRPYETDDASLPAKNNDRLWLHLDGQTGTLDTSADGPKGSVGGRIDPTTGEEWFAFKLTPTPKRQLNLTGGAATATISFEMAESLGLPPTLEVRLYFSDALVGSGEAQGQLQGGQVSVPVNLPGVVPPNTDVRLDLCLCGSGTTVVRSYSFNADGQSYLDLPIVTPVFVQKSATSGAQAVAGAAERIEGDVETERQGDRWVARQTITFSNQLAVDEADLEFTTGAGSIDVATWDDDGYQVVAELEARGDTEQEALQGLADLRVDHGDPVEDGVASIYTRATTADGDWNDQSVSLTAQVPATWDVADTQLETGAGSLGVQGVRGASLTADTAAGSIDLARTRHDSIDLNTDSGSIGLEDVSAHEATAFTSAGSITIQDTDTQSLEATTSSGSIDVSGAKVVDATLDSSAGSITAELESTASGTIGLSTSAGTIELTVPDGSTYGYDASATSAAGSTSIDLADAEDVGPQSPQQKHVQTRGFATKAIQVVVTADTAAGGVAIQGD